jgi:hypothetical protein
MALIAAVGLGLVLGLIWAFKQNPRRGSSFVNSVVNPLLIRRGLAGKGRAEIGTLEHFGRRSGKRRLAPVYPEPTAVGLRIMVPLGEQSEWARNVISAGRCRLQLHDLVYELDEPAMLPPTDVAGVPAIIRRFQEYLGFRYMTLRLFSSGPGNLDAPPLVETIEQPVEAVRGPAVAATT